MFALRHITRVPVHAKSRPLFALLGFNRPNQYRRFMQKVFLILKQFFASFRSEKPSGFFFAFALPNATALARARNEYVANSTQIARFIRLLPFVTLRDWGQGRHLRGGFVKTLLKALFSDPKMIGLGLGSSGSHSKRGKTLPVKFGKVSTHHAPQITLLRFSSSCRLCRSFATTSESSSNFASSRGRKTSSQWPCS